MAQPLMPKATAVWLVDNTKLTFEQIAAFCGLHELEVQAIADGEVAIGMQGLDPVAAGPAVEVEVSAHPYDVLGIATRPRWVVELPTADLHVMPREA